MDIVSNSTDGNVEIRTLKVGDVFQFRRGPRAYMVLDTRHMVVRHSCEEGTAVYAVKLSTGTVNWYYPDTHVQKLSATLTVGDA